MERERFLQAAMRKTKEFCHACFLMKENGELEHLWDQAEKLHWISETNVAGKEEWIQQMNRLRGILTFDAEKEWKEWYEAQAITEQVCVVFGAISSAHKISFTMIYRLEKEEPVLCHIHHSFQYSEDISDSFSYILSVHNTIVPDEILSLQHRCSIDMLTGVYNRGFMEELINRRLKEKRRASAFIMIDMDDFKLVNDTWGHVFGDELLKGFAEFLKDAFIAGGEIGRLGGDEFCVFINQVFSREAVKSWLTSFFRILEKKDLTNQRITIRCSAGVCFSNEKSSSFLELYDKADQALYEAKRSKKGGFVVYGEGM